MLKKILMVLFIFLLCCGVALGADFLSVWEKTILPHEGGYSNNIHDPGNWTGGKEGKGRFLGTKYGIAASVYGTSLLRKGIIIKHLTKDQAREIFKRDYWDAFSFGDLKSQGIADELCDETVNTGPGQVQALLEKAFKEISWTGIKVPVPPKLTPETIQWINDYTQSRCNRVAFYNSLRVKRVKFYVGLCHAKPQMRQFFFSWVDRSVD